MQIEVQLPCLISAWVLRTSSSVAGGTALWNGRRVPDLRSPAVFAVGKVEEPAGHPLECGATPPVSTSMAPLKPQWQRLAEELHPGSCPAGGCYRTGRR